MMNITSEVRLITPEDAQALIDECTHDAETMSLVMRPVSKAVVKHYASQMESGLWTLSGSLELATIGQNGSQQRFLVDGNHRMRAVVEAGKPQEFFVIERKLRDLSDVRQLYAQTDRGRARTVADSLVAYDAIRTLGLPNKYELTKLVGAMNVIIADFSSANVRVPDELMLEKCAAYAPYYLKYYSWRTETDHKTWKMFQRRDEVALALVAMRYQPGIADTYWRSVVTGGGIPFGSPALKARDYIMTRVAAGKHIGDERMVVRRKLAVCWNKAYRSEDMSALRVPKGDIPILGTPFVINE